MSKLNPHPCPHCKAVVAERLQGIWPFCSKRCKMSDLGKWSAEEYRIPAGPAEPLGLNGESDEMSHSEEHEEY